SWSSAISVTLTHSSTTSTAMCPREKGRDCRILFIARSPQRDGGDPPNASALRPLDRRIALRARDHGGRNSHLENRVEVERLSRWVLPNPESLLVGKEIRRHRQVVGCRHALEDPGGEIVLRAVAGAEEAARPVGR